MKPISRRAVLTMGGLGLASTAVGGTGLWRELNPSLLDPAAGESFAEPEVLRSQGGRLQIRLEAALGTHDVAGRKARTMGYNGGVPGPTLRLRPGDTLRLDLVNGLDDVTNLHVHGLHVSPEGNGDNIFLAVEPGPSGMSTGCPTTMSRACTGATRTTTATSPTRSSVASTAPLSSRTPSRSSRSTGSGCW